MVGTGKYKKSSVQYLSCGFNVGESPDGRGQEQEIWNR